MKLRAADVQKIDSQSSVQTKKIKNKHSEIRILLFEDMARDAELVRLSLENAGLNCRLTRIDNLADLRGKLKENRFDIVISDYHLPNANINEVLAQTLEIVPNMPFIVVSGLVSEEEVIDLLKSGARDFVSKSNLARLAPAITREIVEADKRRRWLEAERSLRTSEKLLTQVMAASEDAIVLIENGRISDCNAATVTMFKTGTKNVLVGASPLQYSPEVQPDGVSSLLRWRQNLALADKQSFFRFDWHFCRADKKMFPVQVSLTPAQHKGRPLLHMTIVDMSELRNLQDAQAHLAEEERVIGELLQLSFKYSELREFLQAVLSLIVTIPWLPLQQRGAIYLVDEESVDTLRLAGDFQLPDSILEQGRAIPIGGNCFPENWVIKYSDMDNDESLDQGHSSASDLLSAYSKFPLRGDELLGAMCLELAPSMHFNEANRSFLCRIASEISLVIQRFLAEQRIHYQATHNELTNLPNRRLLIRWAQSWWQETVRLEKKRPLVLFEVDNLKQINDSLGRAIADQLLVAIGQRLSELLNEDEFISHLSGDLFCLVSTVQKESWSAKSKSVQTLVEKIHNHIRQPFFINEHELHVTVSVGAAWVPNDGGADDLLVQAEMALHRAKSKIRGSVEIYEPHLAQDVMARHFLENDLRHAINHQELVLYFQPQVSPIDGTIKGCESLLRWKHKELGWISPGQFIPIAEESGLIFSLGDWVLEEACRIAKSWQQSGYNPVPVAVNISAEQFHQKNFLEIICTVLSSTGLDPQWLELEVTESVAMQNAEEVVAVMHQLSQMGVGLAIDDFGTGYSSLSYLQAFPLSKLKVDRAFVKDLGAGDSGSVARFIMQLAQSEGLKTVVEGVETESQREFFCELNCDLIQGYYYSPAVSAEHFVKLLDKGIATPSNQAVGLKLSSDTPTESGQSKD